MVVAETASRASDGMFGRGLEVGESVELTAERLLVEGNHELGVTCGGCSMVVEDAMIRDTLGRSKGNALGDGAMVFDGGEATFRRAIFENNLDHGLLAHAYTAPPTVTLEDVIVRGTKPRASDDGFGRGLAAQNGAMVQGSRVVVEHNHDIGVVSTADKGASSLTLQDSRSFPRRRSPQRHRAQRSDRRLRLDPDDE